MKHLMAFLSVLSALTLSAGQQDHISLNRAVREALVLNGEYLNHLLEADEAGITSESAKRRKRFQLDLNAAYLFKSETLTLETPALMVPGLGKVPGSKIEAGLHHNADINLTVRQPIWTGGILSRLVRMEEVKSALALHRAEIKRNEVAGLVKSSYFRAAMIKERTRALTTLLNTIKLHRTRLSKLVDEGLARRSDLLETLSREEEIGLSLRDLELALTEESVHFEALTGFDLARIEPAFEEIHQGKEEAGDFFRRRHPVLDTLQRRIDLLILQGEIVSGRSKPQIGGFLEFHYGRPGLNFFEPEWAAYVQGGLTLNLPVFNWNQGDGETEQLRLQKARVINQKDDFIRAVDEALDSLYAGLDSLSEKIVRVRRLIDYSREDVEIKSRLYQERQIPNIDYLSALETESNYRHMLRELFLQRYLIAVRINSMIGRSGEEIQ